jgi:hypothetical protein
MPAISEIINKPCMKCYNPSQHLTVDTVTDLFRGRFVFKQYIKKYANILASTFSNSLTSTGILTT